MKDRILNLLLKIIEIIMISLLIIFEKFWKIMGRPIKFLWNIIFNNFLKIILEKLHIVDFIDTCRDGKQIHVKINLKNLPENLSGLKIVQLTDLHYCQQKNNDLINQIIKSVNKINPDLVLITGDFVSDDANQVEALAKVLSKLKCPKNQKFGVFGNHDILPEVKFLLREKLLKISEIQMLENEVVWPFGENNLAIVGMGELKSKDFKPYYAFQNINKNSPRIVMSHQPDTAQELQRYKADLILSGHLHGGGIRIPIYGSVFPLAQKIYRLIPKIVFDYIIKLVPVAKNIRNIKHGEWCEGIYKLKRIDGDENEYNILHVSRGVGSGPKGIRVFCPPEINIIQIFPQNQK